MAGRDERTIAELMGNSPTIVRRRYAAWLPEAHPEAVELHLDRAIVWQRPRDPVSGGPVRKFRFRCRRLALSFER
jgi:hypothetical protein